MHFKPLPGWLLVGLATATGVQPATALQDAPLDTFAFDGGRFVIARTASNDCIVALQGLVTTAATHRFDDVVKAAAVQGCRSPMTLLLESPGGSHFDGLRLGRQVRYEGMRTVARYECASACATIFMGGVERTLWGSRAAIGLHQIAEVRGSAAVADGWCVQSGDSLAALELRKYLRFVIPAAAERIYRIVMTTSCKSIDWVTGSRALELGLATKVEAEGVDVFGPKELRRETTPDPPQKP